MGIVNRLSDLRIWANIPCNNGKWSQFIIHGLPTVFPNGGEIQDKIVESFDNNDSSMKHGQRLSQLSSLANRDGKEALSIVISLAEKVSLETLDFRRVIRYN